MSVKNLNKEPIDDGQIVELYRQGVSQKDIATNYSVSVRRTQKVLRKAGFTTHRYRYIDDDMKRCVIALIKDGCTYSKIENICDIGFHAVREIVENNNLKGVSNKMRFRKSKKKIKYVSSPKYEIFLEEYRRGNSFVFLCNTLNFKDNQITTVFNLISEQDKEKHTESLRERILSLNDNGFLSEASIAKQLVISPSIARKIIGKT